MQCPVCAALNREHNHECEAEADATLKQRMELIGWRRGENRVQLEEEVLRSRKRQAHIAFELHEHQAAQHPNAQKVRAAGG